MKDYVRSLKGVLYERASSPLYGAFALSFLVINWKIPVALFFGTATVNERMKLVEGAITSVGIRELLIHPFWAACVVIALVPLFANGLFAVSEAWRWVSLWIRRKFERTERLTVDQSVALRFEITDWNERFQRMLKSKDEQIESLQKGNPAKATTVPHREALQTIGRFMKKFQVEKIVIGLGGDIFFDDDKIAKANQVNIADETYPHHSSEDRWRLFEKALLDLSPSYIQLIPESRIGSPYVVKLTDLGLEALGQKRQS